MNSADFYKHKISDEENLKLLNEAKDYVQILLSADTEDIEYPKGFDADLAVKKLEKLISDLHESFEVTLKDYFIQDATFHAQIGITDKKNNEIFLIFSNFGSLVTIHNFEKIILEDQGKILRKLEGNGYQYIPDRFLFIRYSGLNKSDVNLKINWYERYFFYIT